MEIRLASYEPTSLVAVSLAHAADEMPYDVRLVDPAVAAELETVLGEHRDEAVLGVDLDALVEEARARVAAARR